MRSLRNFCEHSENRVANKIGNEAGFSMYELLVVLAISGILMAAATDNLKILDRQLSYSSEEMVAFIKRTRSKAIASTSAYTIEPLTNTQAIAKVSSECGNGPYSTDSKLFLSLPAKVTFASNSWSACFSARGLASSNSEIIMNDSEGNSNTIEVFLGGAARIKQ